jgi:hypothetical protein
VELAGYLSTAKTPAGDATLVNRDTVAKAAGSGISVWDLFVDNGGYYFAKTRDAVPAQVRGKKLQADESGRQKAVAAAKLAAKGDLNDARKQMALAYEPANPKVAPTLLAPGVKPSIPAKELKLKHTSAFEVGNITDNRSHDRPLLACAHDGECGRQAHRWARVRRGRGGFGRCRDRRSTGHQRGGGRRAGRRGRAGRDRSRGASPAAARRNPGLVVAGGDERRARGAGGLAR